MSNEPHGSKAEAHRQARPERVGDDDLVESHFRALRRALRAKRVATLSDLSLLLASDEAELTDALALLVQAGAGDRRANELAMLKVDSIGKRVPQSSTPPRAAFLLLALERLTASN